MANGTRGDHPFTDIVVYGMEVYSPEVDALVREVSALASVSQSEELQRLLLSNPYQGSAGYLEPRLRKMRDRMRADARERGWEVDP